MIQNIYLYFNIENVYNIIFGNCKNVKPEKTKCRKCYEPFFSNSVFKKQIAKEMM